MKLEIKPLEWNQPWSGAPNVHMCEAPLGRYMADMVGGGWWRCSHEGRHLKSFRSLEAAKAHAWSDHCRRVSELFTNPADLQAMTGKE